MNSAIDFVCDECGAHIDLRQPVNLCPHCGGMLEVQDEIRRQPDA